MFGPGSGGKCPGGGVSSAGSGCEPWSFSHLSECCRTVQPDTEKKIRVEIR